MSWYRFFSSLFKRSFTTLLVATLLIPPVVLTQGCASYDHWELAIEQAAPTTLPSGSASAMEIAALPQGSVSASAMEIAALPQGWESAAGSTDIADARHQVAAPGGPSSSRGMQEQAVQPLKEGAGDLREAVPSTGGLRPAGTTSSVEEVWLEAALVPAGEEQQVQRTVEPVSEKEPIYDIPIKINSEVDSYVELFTGPYRERFRRYLCRSSEYLSMMREILREHGLPQDLVYIALVESGFSTDAYSHARAVGPWQFIKSTGNRYGLRVDWWVDERRDPVKSTHAACRYLKDLYNLFSSWELAMAAYNGGEVRVEQAIRQAGTNDFWELAKTRHFREETKNYVPQVLAATIVAKNPERYHFTNIAYGEPFAWDEVELDDAMDLNLIAKMAGTRYETIKALNPELLRTATPPRRYVVRIPAGSQKRFVEHFAGASSEKLVTWRKYKVRRGDTLSFIAERFGTSVEAIVQVNNLRDASNIVAGRSLIVPTSVDGATGGTEVAFSASQGNEPEPQDGRFITHVISRGESLGKIAESYNTTLGAIMDANGLKSAHQIVAGGTLLIPVQLDSPVSGTKKPAGPIGVSSPSSSSSAGRAEFHVVSPGESLWKIAEAYGTTVEVLQRLNGIRNPGLIRAGQRLRVS